MPGIITQLNYVDNRLGSHICALCSAPRNSDCGGNGHCHTQVFCRTKVKSWTCGDGHLDSKSEQCDDGNRDDGDGCSSVCRLEKGFKCLAVTGGEKATVCSDIDECLQKSGTCGKSQQCVNKAGGYTCECNHKQYEAAGQCKPCNAGHVKRGICADGRDCAEIKRRNPSAGSGICTFAVSPLSLFFSDQVL